MKREGETRRVTVELLVKATSQEEARELVVARLNEWYVDPAQSLVPATASFPVGTLMFFHVTPASGHRAVAV